MFTIRILRRTGPGEFQNPFKGLQAWLALPSLMGGAVHQVTEERAVMNAERIDEGLRTGTLRSTDLVEFDGTWVALADAIPFLDSAAIAQRRERRVAFLKASGLALLTACMVALYAAAQSR